MRVVAATGDGHSRGIGDRNGTLRRSKGRAKCRDNVTEFYARHGYAVLGEAETLFGVIRHVRLPKAL